MDSNHRLTLRSRFLAVAAIVGLAATSAHHAQAQTAEKWDPAIAKFEAQDKLEPPPRDAVVFIGASSIVRWNLPEYFPELGAAAINRGFGGSESVDSVRYASSFRTIRGLSSTTPVTTMSNATSRHLKSPTSSRCSSRRCTTPCLTRR